MGPDEAAGHFPCNFNGLGSKRRAGGQSLFGGSEHWEPEQNDPFRAGVAVSHSTISVFRRGPCGDRLEGIPAGYADYAVDEQTEHPGLTTAVFEAFGIRHFQMAVYTKTPFMPEATGA